MNLTDQELLRRLGAGESIDQACQAAGITRDQFDRWWQATLEARCPDTQGHVPASVEARVTIERDACGIPHIFAGSDADLFFGYGYAMAQDRLFQLDYLRRKGLGRLSEILGAEGLAQDTIARTVGLNRIATAEWDRLEPEAQQLLQSFSAGINALIENSGDRLPIEFDLLDYRPEPWTPIDSLALESEFRWYLTGRLPVIVLPELAQRTLGDGPLLEEFLLGEADDEVILHPGDYTPHEPDGDTPREPVGRVMNDPEGHLGSNNWVLSGSRTTTGHAMLASDPHIAFEAVSCWYEAHLCGGSFNVAGTGYVGMPAIMFGRNEQVAWGITNNICSLRDLYQEKTDPAHPGCFLYDGDWEPARECVEVIKVRDAEPVTKTVRFSRNGPIVDELLPAEAQDTGPVALRWLGAHQGGWLTGMLKMDRAADVSEFVEAMRPWHVPTFSLMIADVQGHIAYKTSGRIPIRKTIVRGYRPGWDPEHQWQGLMPFEAMPHVVDPKRGWLASANNRLVADDYPYPVFGCWSSGWRALRIRQMIEASEQHSLQDIQAMQNDTRSLRAEELVPALVTILLSELKTQDDERMGEAVGYLEAWDLQVECDSVAAALFNVFYEKWGHAVASERFDAGLVELIASGIKGCTSRLLQADPIGWFAPDTRDPRIIETFRAALDMLAERFGANMADWTWGKLHRMPLRHVLSSRGDLGSLFDHGGAGVRGDIVTICNTGSGDNWRAATGGGYRLIVDMQSAPPVLLAVDAQSQSGHPGSTHYGDQYDTWRSGSYREIALNREPSEQFAANRLTLDSSTGNG